MSLKARTVTITEHAQRRLQEMRQQDIGVHDILDAAAGIPGLVSSATRFRGFVASSGRMFDLVVKDLKDRRLVITIIGK